MSLRNKLSSNQSLNLHIYNTQTIITVTMKFALILSTLLPLLVAGASIEDRAVQVMDTELETVDVNTFGANVVLNVQQLKTPSVSVNDKAQAICPPGYPKYCPRYNFCCPAIAQACCPRACCLSAGGFCGTDGLCYRYV